MAGESTEHYTTDRGNQVVAERVGNTWQVTVIGCDGHSRPANEAVQEAFARYQKSLKTSSDAGQDIGQPLKELIDVAEKAGLLKPDTAPEEVLEPETLQRLSANLGVKPFVDNVRTVWKTKEDADILVERHFNHTLLEADNQVAGRGASPLLTVTLNDVEPQNLPNLRGGSIQKV